VNSETSREAGGQEVLIGLLGPTAVGKSAVAAALARSLGVRVISCDSMQVYRGFPILTNQPTPEEARGVEHALVGVVDPMELFSAAEYAERARPLIAEDVARSGSALLAGGTGLYLRAAVAPLAVAPGDSAVRARLEERAAAEGAGALHNELSSLDPAAAAAVDPRNARRVVRALEAVLVGGGGWSGRDDLWDPPYDRPTLAVGLTLDRGILYPRIDARAGRMLREGAIEEVLSFREERGLEATAPGGPGIRSAIGYGEISRYLLGEISREEAAVQMAAATRRYARRQLTWLRKVRDAVMIDVQDRDPEDIAREILDLANAKRTAEEPRQR
jgi:tRNA dimethylallyltransferase